MPIATRSSSSSIESSENGEPAKHHASTAVVVANWLAFLCLGTATVTLLLQAIRYAGPSRKEKYYNGFREERMLAFFINLNCCLAYFAKILESMTDEGAGFPPLTTIKYLDYAVTCPLIALDLLWNMGAPYKWTMAAMIAIVLITGVASSRAAAPASYAWFAMGMVLFVGVYYSIVYMIMERLEFFVRMARDSNAKQSIKFLKIGCYIFFSVWWLYPVLWVLGPHATKVVSVDLEHVLLSIGDVFAKSAYGFALLYFRLYFDKKLSQSGIEVDEFDEFSRVEMCKKKDAKGMEEGANSGVYGGYDQEESQYGERHMEEGPRDRYIEEGSSTDASDYWNQYGGKGAREGESYLEAALKNMNDLADKKRSGQFEQQEKGARQGKLRDEIRRTTQDAASSHNGSFLAQQLPRQAPPGMPLFNRSSPDHLTNSRRGRSRPASRSPSPNPSLRAAHRRPSIDHRS